MVQDTPPTPDSASGAEPLRSPMFTKRYRVCPAAREREMVKVPAEGKYSAVSRAPDAV